MKMIENEMNVAVPLEIVKASDIEPKEVKWLWYPYIPFGKVTLLQGDPGDGKSKFMLSLAALLSKGEHLPFADEEEREPITIIYQTTEDDADDTVVPRFNSAGGNGDNLIFIKEDMKSLSFGDNRIREAIEKYNAKLLILDPMSSYIGESCSMNNANETRAEFNHLIAVAKDTGCAIVIIAHMNKMRDTNPLYRTNGSIDIAGAARSILAITRTANKEAPAERYLVQVKSNLAPTGSAILFEVAESGVNFVSELEMTAEEAFSSLAPKMGRPSKKELKAKEFILEMLKDGEMLANDCEAKLEGLAAGGHRRPLQKVQLTAGAADLAGTGALGADLAVQVHGDAVVDGDKVLDVPDGTGSVAVGDGVGHHAGILPHPVVQILGADGKAEHALIAVDVLALVGDLPGPVHIQIAVAQHLRVDAQIPQIGLGQHLAHGIGQ